MPDLTKIATCSYCGTRTVLRLTGRVQHELACAACGARLHTMKPLRAEDARRATTRPARPLPRHEPFRHKDRHKPRRSRRLTGLFAEILDEIEDIFD